MEQHQTSIKTHPDAKQIVIDRAFKAPVGTVWQAWTTSAMLDQWWAPKPWLARTTTMNFAPGGEWLYAMVGPDGTEIFAKVEYKEVKPQESFTALDAFCDREGKIDESMSRMHWYCSFKEEGGVTNVHIEITFDKTEDLTKILEMGFAEGFTAAHANLDELLLEK